MKSLARDLRKQGVLSEVLLWQYLKGRKLNGYQFMRQKPIGNYIIDFYCGKLKLAIEIDGISHDGKFQYDTERQKSLESMGLTVLRFSDVDVKKDLGAVLASIEGWIKERDDNPLTYSSLIKCDKGGCDLEACKALSGQIDNPLTPFSKGE